jgi:hypothetical protein
MNAISEALRPITRLAAMRVWMPISLLSCAFALGIAGCGSGGDGTIPPNDAENLLNLVTAVQGDISDGECDRATQHAQELVTEVGQLPDAVDPDVASELAKASTNLQRLANTQCTDTGASGPSGAETSTTTSAPETTTTSAPQTTTTEPSTTTQSQDEAPTETPNQQPPTGQNQNQNQGNQTQPNGGGPASGGVTGGGNAG